MQALKAWFDVLTPKQVLFFKPVIDQLRGRGFQVIVTSREYREVGQLAKMVGLPMTFVGERGEKGRVQQLVAATRRQADIIPIIEEFGPDVAVSVASAVCARVAFGLGVKHIAVNDSPHSETAARLSVPLSERLLCPWVIPYSAWSPYGIERSKIIRYRALDPAAWLKRKPMRGFVPKLPAGKRTIVVRVEESDAPYLLGANKTWMAKALSAISEAFPDLNLVALTRYGHQMQEVKKRFGSRFIIPEQVVDGRALLGKADLFVGMGGTMTAEAALMGVPTVSAFQGSYVIEDYLASNGLVTKAKDVSSLVKSCKLGLRADYAASIKKKSRGLLSRMEDPVEKIVSSVVQLAKQV